MGLYKLCKHKGRDRDRCSDAWWGSYQYRGKLHRVSLARWSGRELTSKAAANAVLDDLRTAVREGALPNGVPETVENSVGLSLAVDLLVCPLAEAHAVRLALVLKAPPPRMAAAVAVPAFVFA